MTTMLSPSHGLASPLLRLLPRRAWGLGLIAWALGGCLLPQDESFLTELPIPRNNPPRILESQVQPPNRIIKGYGLVPACALEFSVIVEDLDVADNLTAYWYVDYDPSVQSGKDGGTDRGADRVQSVPPSKEGKPARDERATLRAIYNSPDLYRLNTPGDHVVEVLIADRPVIGREPQPQPIRLADGTYVNNPGFSASYVWFVHTEAGATCP